MRKRLFLIAILGSLLIAQPQNDAQPARIAGDWLGTLEVGPQKLRLALHITANDQGDLTSTFDSLDQGGLGIPVRQTTFADNRLRFDIAALSVKYEGVLNDDGDEITGTFTQGTAMLPLQFKRSDATQIANVTSRPQDPKPPYPYREEEVIYQHGTIQLAGTLTLPAGEGPFPAAVMITGSGAQDRNETLLGHKPFWIIADNLTRRGIAVLRVDDRGVGKSTGRSSLATLQDMAGDVLAGVQYLKGRTEIDAQRIGVIGHSEGGIVGPIAAVRSEEVAFVVMLAGTGVPGDEVVYLQGELIGRAAGAPNAALAQTRRLQEIVFGIVKAEPDAAAAAVQLRTALEGLGLPNAAISTTIAQWNSPELRSMLVFDPADVLRQLQVPVLALNGERDVQVSPKQNLPAISAALAEGENDDFTVMEMPGLNHLFQTCLQCTVAEYGDLEESFSPEAMRVMGDWIVQHMMDKP